MNSVAAKYRQLADAVEVQIAALTRQRDIYRSLANFFDPPPFHPPLPPIVPPPAGPDPDFDDVPPYPLDDAEPAP
ncbi:MAG TPA: hypothetical protein VEC57_14470 [Candidatus Limnocylindrales bacterium]|nr:hypothetical protein [Candidatus Limnocylindrales bacterium]